MLPFFEKQESVKLAVAFKKKPEAPYPRSLFFFTSSTSTLRSSPIISIKLCSFPNPFSQTKKHTKMFTEGLDESAIKWVKQVHFVL